MAKRDIEATQELVRENISQYYDMTAAETVELIQMAKRDAAKAIFYAFRYGYVMGGRASAAGQYRESKRA